MTTSQHCHLLVIFINFFMLFNISIITALLEINCIIVRVPGFQYRVGYNVSINNT